MEFYNKLLMMYSKVSFPEQYNEVVPADKAISWYLADSSNKYITINKQNNINIVELDIRQAFTNICRCLFPPTDEFIIKMNDIEDKKARNIFIATSLVNTPYLHLLNVISKLVIIGTLASLGDSTLLELKKDGALIACADDVANKIININEETDNDFVSFIHDNGFIFHMDQYVKYIRSNRTTYTIDSNNNFDIKGICKYQPEYILETQKRILFEGFFDHNEISKIYSEEYLNIILLNHLNELLTLYYKCSNDRFLSESGKYVKMPTEMSARNYLRTFIYPIILSTKL